MSLGYIMYWRLYLNELIHKYTLNDGLYSNVYMQDLLHKTNTLCRQ